MSESDSKSPKSKAAPLEKVPTGIGGLDDVTLGGLPKGRTTLVCGGAGSGKTMLGMEFLTRGTLDYDEPGVFFCFEETIDELVTNMASLGYDLIELQESNRLFIDHIRVERSEIEETGEYDLSGLFIRLQSAITAIGAKRVVLDTIETLFAGLTNKSILRAELRRLLRWLKDQGMTAVVTAERGESGLTRHNLEEYVSDCVISLDQRVVEQITTRRLHILKYRGSTHGSNEYPFLITDRGIKLFPITSLALDHEVSDERVSTGIPRLDEMMGGEGYYQGSTVLVSGTAGTGKTSVAARFAHATCERGERCLYFAFEESPSQILRNLRSIGTDLDQWRRKGLLTFHARRPTAHGLEHHLITLYGLIEETNPKAVIIDPITNFGAVAKQREVKGMLTRIMDHLKSRGVTALLTSLTSPEGSLEESEVGVSSLVDTWLMLRDIEIGGERNRALHLLKSRGMGHSNQIREFLLTDQGIELSDVYVGPGGVLTGTARATKEAEDRAEEAAVRQEIDRLESQMRRLEESRAAKLKEIEAEMEGDRDALLKKLEWERQKLERIGYREKEMAALRRSDPER